MTDAVKNKIIVSWVSNVLLKGTVKPNVPPCQAVLYSCDGKGGTDQSVHERPP